MRGFVLLGLILVPPAAAIAQDSVRASLSSGVFSGSAHFGAPPPAQRSQAVAGAPYSAEEINKSVQTLADGTHITRESPTRKIYRDSAGRTRTERPLLAAAARRQKADPPVIVEIIDPVEHVKYTLDDINKVAHKQAMAAPDRIQKRTATLGAPVSGAGSAELTGAAGAEAPAGVAVEEHPTSIHEKLGTQTMQGLQVEGTRNTVVYPIGWDSNDRPITTVHETWRSLELNVTILSTDNDPRFGETTQKLTNMQRSEPDPSLFLPPPDYTVIEEKGDFTIKWGSENQVSDPAR